MKAQRFEDLFIRKQYRKKPVIKPSKSIVGFDTETRKGEAFLTVSTDTRLLQFAPLDTRLDFLCYRPYSKTLNLFFNIDFDMTALLKGMPENNFYELNNFGKTTYKKYKIRWIKRKFFSITKQGDCYTFYDIQQFFNCSLESAASKYLNKHKKEMSFENFDVKGYAEKHIERIKEYCLQDAVLTKELGEVLQDMCSEIGLDFNKPISPAYLSQRYFSLNCDIPLMGNKNVSEYAFKSYYGGRFETFKRGYFPVVYKYDLRSAYPSYIKDLIDINLGGWVKLSYVPKDAYYGFIHCVVSTNGSEIQPLPHRENNLITFPIMEDVDKYITLEEYQFITSNNYGVIEVIDGWYYFPKMIKKPFEIMQDLYDYRIKLKSENNDLEHLIKIIMNSLYGKFFQQTKRLMKTLETDVLHDYRDLFFNGSWDTYKTEWVTGNLFNPVYASILTSKCRLELLKASLSYESSVICFYTDSIFSTERIIVAGSKFGDWSYEGLYQGVVLGNGVYTLRNDKETITRFRGFDTTGKIDLFMLLAENKEKILIDIPLTRVIKIGQWLISHQRIPRGMLNTFTDIVKHLDINFDTKREWAMPFRNALQTLQTSFQTYPDCPQLSIPLLVSQQPS